MTTTDDDHVRLPALLVELREDGYDTGPYRAFAEAARDGLYPARLRNNQWYAKRADKARIAAAMGMRRTAPTKQRQTVAA
jgi:hypothetical protein